MGKAFTKEVFKPDSLFESMRLRSESVIASSSQMAPTAEEPAE